MMPSSTSICSKSGRLLEEAGVLLVGAEAHDPLDAGAVVPGPVEEHHLAGGRQVGDVALEVPLGLLAVGGRRQRRDARDAGAEVLGDPLDRRALARRVAALEDDDDALAGGPHPLLERRRGRPAAAGSRPRRRRGPSSWVALHRGGPWGHPCTESPPRVGGRPPPSTDLRNRMPDATPAVTDGPDLRPDGSPNSRNADSRSNHCSSNCCR